ncbi:MAG: RNA methyltransferase [Pseudomonadota bacterium]|nr:RNA methyltransferase [Pseudomonadota bacterium]
MSRTVTSLTNPTVKAVRALHQRKTREESGRFLAEGLKIVTEAVELGFPPRILMVSPDADHPLLRRAIEAAETARGEVIEVTREILEKVSRRENPQTVVAVFDQRFTPLEAVRPAKAPWVALHRIRDPGNLGTIVRTADAAGCGGVILVGDCVDPYGVEAVRATMGSIFALPLVRTSEAEFLAWRRGWPGSVVGTLLSATVDHRRADYRKPTLILMGNEQAGLPPEMAAACDVAVKIPMRGRADSLNLAIATGIMIYAATDDEP